MLFFDFLLLRCIKDTIFNGTKVQEEVYYVELKISTIKQLSQFYYRAILTCNM